jgi:hypothetical protein
VNSQFHFARALQSAIGNDRRIFKFATHENSIVNAIIIQLDQETIKKIAFFLKPLANPANQSNLEERNMIDLCKVVKTIITTHTKGSNSIKAVLPASLNSSQFLKEILQSYWNYRPKQP